MIPSPIRVALANSAEFEQLCHLPNEQRVIRTGAVLCPKPRFHVSNLEVDVCYRVSLKFRRVSNKRWKYENKWVETKYIQTPSTVDPDDNGDAEFILGTQSGYKWLCAGIQFHVKLTNHPELCKNDMTYLMGQSKYQPYLVLTQVSLDPISRLYKIQGAPLEFMFPSMEFITVTRYYNPLVSDIKCDLNKCPNRHARKLRNDSLKQMGSDVEPVIRKRKLDDVESYQKTMKLRKKKLE